MITFSSTILYDWFKKLVERVQSIKCGTKTKLDLPYARFPAHFCWLPQSIAIIDPFSLYVLFSHFRPRDALMGIFLLFFFISYEYICTCIRRHLKETIPSSSITWSEMGKQNIQAKTMSTLYRIACAPTQKPYRIGLLFTKGSLISARFLQRSDPEPLRSSK